MFNFFNRRAYVLTLFTAILLAVTWVGCRRSNRREFVNPVAYTMLGDRLFVVEKEGNRLLELSFDAADKPLRLHSRRRIEPDDKKHYYMVRKIYPGPRGRLVAQSYIYNRDTLEFTGYRFRAYDPSNSAPPRELLRVALSEPTLYPEMRYACDKEGNHYFLNTCLGEFNIWKIRDENAGILINDSPGMDVITLGETNNAMSGWNSIQLAEDGRIFVACGADGLVVEYGPDGERRRQIGEVGVEAGYLLAPDNLTFMTFNPGGKPALTIASTGNRTWLQYDDKGQRIRLMDPLAEDYPHDDIMVGSLFEHPELGAWAFDLVNRCLVFPGPSFITIDNYRLPPWRAICLAVVITVILAVLFLGFYPLKSMFARVRFPLFVKMLLLFVPLMLAGNMLVEHQVRLIMRADKEDEAVLRLANLARAILNTVSLDDLEAVKTPQDRNSPEYERVYQVATRILDAQHVEHTPKWIIHKVFNERFYFGLNIWRGPIFEPFIVNHEREVFLDAVKDKTPQYGRFRDDQGEWFSHISPILDGDGNVIYLLELYRPTESMDRADRLAAARARRIALRMTFLLLIVILVFAYVFTHPLRRLIHATEIISAGGFNHKIKLRSRDELGDLARAFNRMVDRLRVFTEERAREAVEKERIQSELRFAREMQQSMLPKEFPPYAGLGNVELVARMEPAREIGGDYFDFFQLDDDHLGVVVADVAGKGVPAGLFLMSFRTMLRGVATGRRQAAQVITEVNRMLAADNPSLMFVTVFYMVCNIRTGKALYCNAGHPPPFLRNAGAWRMLAGTEGRGMAMGVDPNAVYGEGSLEFNAGETLLVYTDGVTEACDRHDNMFGEDGLRRLLDSRIDANPKELTALIVEAAQDYQSGREQFDDITVLTLRFGGGTVKNYEKHENKDCLSE